MNVCVCVCVCASYCIVPVSLKRNGSLALHGKEKGKVIFTLLTDAINSNACKCFSEAAGRFQIDLSL